MEQVRALSRELNPPPGAHLGLRRALESLVETAHGSFSGAIDFSYAASIDAAVLDTEQRRQFTKQLPPP